MAEAVVFPKSGSRQEEGGRDSPVPAALTTEQLLWLDGVFFRHLLNAPDLEPSGAVMKRKEKAKSG
jgi:hypothetical protein